MTARPTFRSVPLVIALALGLAAAPGILPAQDNGDPAADFRSIVAPARDKTLAELPPGVILDMARALEALAGEYPDSNLALQIILGETVEGIDIAELKRLAAQAAKAPAPAEARATEATTATAETDGQPAAAPAPEAAAEPAETAADAAEDPPLPQETAPAAEAAAETAEPAAPLPAPAPAAPEIADAAEPAATVAAEPAPLPPEPAPVVFANLPAAVTACLTVGLLPPVELQIRVEIDPQGQLVGVPEVMNTDQTAPGLREAYLKALLTLDGCAPLRTEAGAGVVIARIAPDGLVSAALDTPPASAAPIDATAEATPPAISPATLLPTDASTEAELALTKKDIREVQARLQVMGFDPNGIDGALGRGARGAISKWQAREGLPETGFLGRAQLLVMKLQSDEAFEEWLKVDANRKLVESGPARSGGTGRYIDSRGCLREANGKAVPNFKAGCR